MIVWVVMDEFDAIVGVFDSLDKALNQVAKNPDRTYVESSIGLKINAGRVD